MRCRNNTGGNGVAEKLTAVGFKLIIQLPPGYRTVFNLYGSRGDWPTKKFPICWESVKEHPNRNWAKPKQMLQQLLHQPTCRFIQVKPLNPSAKSWMDWRNCLMVFLLMQPSVGINSKKNISRNFPERKWAWYIAAASVLILSQWLFIWNWWTGWVSN